MTALQERHDGQTWHSSSSSRTQHADEPDLVPAGVASAVDADGERAPKSDVPTDEGMEKGGPDGGLSATAAEVPDGGAAAWLNCAGASVAFMCSFGIVNSYGVFQDYYKSVRLANESDSVIALIGAIQLFCLYGFGPLVGKLFDSYGAIPMMPIGSFCIVFSLMMLSLAQVNATYQYFLSQAVLFGLGCAMVFTPGLALMGHYFRRQRPLAIGFVAAGSSVGGVIFPIALQRLIPRIGFGWAVRVEAFIALGCLTFACAVSRTRLPLRKTSRAELLQAVDLGGFRDMRYCLATLSAFITFYAIFIPYFYIKQYGELRGMSADLASYLLPLINALGVPARIAPGLLAPRFGVLNLMIFMTTIAGILILALWLPSSGNASIIVFSALYGLFSGPFISLLPAYIGIISPQPVYGARLGALYLIVAVACLVGTPTGGALVGQAGSLQNYRHLIGFSGALVLTGSLILVLIWLLEARSMLERRRQKGQDEPLTWADFRF